MRQVLCQNRARAGLTDPRNIWRTIAFKLAEMHRDIKIDILEALSGDAGNAYPEDVMAQEQFFQLICEPLKRYFATTISSRIVVVIDALDECATDNQDEWRAFLGTIVKWSEELPADVQAHRQQSP